MDKQEMRWFLLLVLGIMAFAVGCTPQGGTEGVEEATNENEAVGDNVDDNVGDNVDGGGVNENETVGDNAVDNEANENDDGNANSDDTADDSLVYEYHREGGIAGFCDIVLVYANGEATIFSCATDPPQQVGSTRLTEDQLVMVRGWQETLESFDTEHKDDAVADAMTVTVDFHGNGEAEATAEDIQAMQDLASTLITQAPTQ